MCIIIAKPKGVDLPPFQHFKNSESKNSDGIGIAFNNGNLLTNIKKDFKDAKECYSYLEENTTKDDIVIIHFRWSTSGLVTEEYRHPYPISNRNKDLKKLETKALKVVAHNGVLTEYEPKDMETNDSMEFTKQVLSKKAIKDNLDSKVIRKLIESHINGDKLAIIDEGALYLIGDFQEDEGCFYSNSDYKYKHYNSYSSYENNYGNTRECEYCDSSKKVKNVVVDNIGFRLCRKCRKKVNKGILTSDIILYKESGASEYANFF